jgi:hypothetical protein
MAAPNRGYVFDNRYQHGHYYPQRGLSFNMLPPGGVSVSYRGSPFIFHGGAWYRPYGSRFVVVAPPLGIGINLLPPYYTTLWFGGIPYYYADNTYYSWRPERRQYVVTTPPDGVGSSTAAPTRNPDLFAYPKNGQTEAQQATDRFECHKWANGQTGFDPTQPLGGVPAGEVAAKRVDYQHAEQACLESRGYTVH